MKHPHLFHKAQRNQFRSRYWFLQVFEEDILVECEQLVKVAEEYVSLPRQRSRYDVLVLRLLYFFFVTLKFGLT